MSLSSAPLTTTGEKYNGLARAEFGFKMLQSMGWKEGQGLGLNNDGISTSVKVKKRRELTGLGADFAENSKHNWTVNTSSFDQVLANLNAIHKNSDSDHSDDSREQVKKKAKKLTSDKKNKKKSKSEAQEKDDSDASREEVKRRSKKEGKKSKKKKHAKVDSDDEEEDEDEDDGNKKTSSKLKVGPTRGLPQGRYTKRESNKNVRSYSNKDLSAILGMAAPVDDWPIAAEVVADVAGNSDSEAEDEEEAEKKSKKKDKEASKQVKSEEKKKKRCVIVIEAPDPGPPDPKTVEREERFFRRAPDWWGCNTFVSGGRLGGAKPPVQTQEDEDEDNEKQKDDESEDDGGFRSDRRGFSEADQERLYLATHQGATSGRQGLGIQDRPKKVAGARWQGSKTRDFGDVETGEGKDNDPESSDKKIKWKKLSESVLDDSKKGKLTLKKLVSRVLAKVEIKDKDENYKEVNEHKLRLELLEKLKGSSKFAVCEQFVQYSATELKRKGSSQDVAGLSKKSKKSS